MEYEYKHDHDELASDNEPEIKKRMPSTLFGTTRGSYSTSKNDALTEGMKPLSPFIKPEYDSVPLSKDTKQSLGFNPHKVFLQWQKLHRDQEQKSEANVLDNSLHPSCNRKDRSTNLLGDNEIFIPKLKPEVGNVSSIEEDRLKRLSNMRKFRTTRSKLMTESKASMPFEENSENSMKLSVERRQNKSDYFNRLLKEIHNISMALSLEKRRSSQLRQCLAHTQNKHKAKKEALMLKRKTLHRAKAELVYLTDLLLKLITLTRHVNRKSLTALDGLEVERRDRAKSLVSPDILANMDFRAASETQRQAAFETKSNQSKVHMDDTNFWSLEEPKASTGDPKETPKLLSKFFKVLLLSAKQGEGFRSCINSDELILFLMNCSIDEFYSSNDFQTVAKGAHDFYRVIGKAISERKRHTDRIRKCYESKLQIKYQQAGRFVSSQKKCRECASFSMFLVHLCQVLAPSLPLQEIHDLRNRQGVALIERIVTYSYKQWSFDHDAFNGLMRKGFRKQFYVRDKLPTLETFKYHGNSLKYAPSFRSPVDTEEAVFGRETKELEPISRASIATEKPDSVDDGKANARKAQFGDAHFVSMDADVWKTMAEKVASSFIDSLLTNGWHREPARPEMLASMHEPESKEKLPPDIAIDLHESVNQIIDNACRRAFLNVIDRLAFNEMMDAQWNDQVTSEEAPDERAQMFPIRSSIELANDVVKSILNAFASASLPVKVNIQDETANFAAEFADHVLKSSLNKNAAKRFVDDVLSQFAHERASENVSCPDQIRFELQPEVNKVVDKTIITNVHDVGQGETKLLKAAENARQIALDFANSVVSAFVESHSKAIPTGEQIASSRSEKIVAEIVDFAAMKCLAKKLVSNILNMTMLRLYP